MNNVQHVTKPRTVAAFSIILLALAFAAVTSPAEAQTPVNLVSFASGGPVSPRPPGVIAQGRDGNLYSTAGNGAVFSVSPAGVLTTVYSFQATDGNSCNS